MVPGFEHCRRRPGHETQLRGLALLHRGKVRDIYSVDAAHLLIVTYRSAERLLRDPSDPIPGKGRVLHQISEFWFERRRAYLSPTTSATARSPRRARCRRARAAAGRAARRGAKRLRAIRRMEAVVRGYLMARAEGLSAQWRHLRHQAPARLQLARASRPNLIFAGDPGGARRARREYFLRARPRRHRRRARARSTRHRTRTLPPRRRRTRGAWHHHRRHQVRVRRRLPQVKPDADRHRGAHPDSSRFWPAGHLAVGASPPSFDKQYVRDYLETLDWNKRAPLPR